MNVASNVNAAAPPITFHWNVTNRMNQGAGEDSTLLSFGHTDSVETCATLCAAWRAKAAGTSLQRCRSFTRFANSYFTNISLAGKCFDAWLSWVDRQRRILQSARNALGPGRLIWMAFSTWRDDVRAVVAERERSRLKEEIEASLGADRTAR